MELIFGGSPFAGFKRQFRYWLELLSPVWPRWGGGALGAGPAGPYKVYGYFRYVLVMIPGMCYSPIPQSEVRSGS